MNDIPKSILTILALLGLSLSSIGQTSQTNAIDQIDSIITAYMTTYKMVGVSIGIVKDGKIYLTKGYGTAEIGKVKPVDSLTNFLTCSITKLFTATAIMQLSEQGKMDISKKLIYYLPDFKMKDKRYQNITIEHLLTHTSGLYWDMELKHSPNDSSSLRKLVYSLDDKILAFAPGTKFNATETYSNAAYDILGYLVQEISGKPYQEYIRDNILVKANMSYSSIDYNIIPTDRRSSPHILKRKVVKIGGMYSENVEHSPSANLNSCSIDLCNWMMNNLNIYNYPSSFNGVLQNSTLQNMWTTRHVAPQNKKVSIGLGWWITNSDDLGKYYWHVGGNPGFSATLMLLPEHDFGITVLSNGMYAEQVVWNKIPFDIINLFKAEWKN
ncbi:MAG: beta-lactamase family protein [Saprospirales bacterium]|nr:beta-lactamase family protein [Saprospirales bacterium]